MVQPWVSVEASYLQRWEARKNRRRHSALQIVAGARYVCERQREVCGDTAGQQVVVKAEHVQLPQRHQALRDWSSQKVSIQKNTFSLCQ